MKNYYSLFFISVFFLWVSPMALGNSNFNKTNFILQNVSQTYDMSFDYRGGFDALDMSGFTGAKMVVNSDLGVFVAKVKAANLKNSRLVYVSDCSNSDKTVNVAQGVCGANVNYTLPTTTTPDAKMVLASGSIANNGFFPVGKTMVVYEERTLGDGTATTNPITTCSFNITVIDNEKPILKPGSDRNVDLEADCQITIPDLSGDVTDNCGATITQNPAIGSKVALAHNGTTTVTVTAKDAAGNTDIKVVTLTAKDVTQPVLTVNAVQDVNLDASCEITVPDVRGSATDNCTFTITQSPAIGSKVTLAHNGKIAVTVTAKDAAGNTDIKVVTLTAKDVTQPVLTVNAVQDVNLDASCEITVPDVRGSATDNCTFTITQSPAIGSKVALAHNGTTTVTVTAKDAAGNTDIKVVTLTAKDVTQPVLTVNAVQDVNLDAS
ncbi:hypothetical protein ES711_16080, partial [Gelidibacter salicanalis]